MGVCFSYHRSILRSHIRAKYTPQKKRTLSLTLKQKLKRFFFEINESYIASVKPIFKNSCFDCHSSSTYYPWYSKVPGAKHLIESDISEAKEHLDMGADFPFKGHGSPKEDLEAIDTSTPAGELMLMQSIAFAQFERQTIVDRIKKGARARAERGLANGYIPVGFKPVEHKPNYREVDEPERAYVEMIFRKLIELKKINHLMEHLNEKGFRTKEFVTKNGTKSRGNRWTLSSLHSILTNRSYIGEREVNKRFRGTDQSILKDDERYFYVDAHWPALIPEGLFYDVQRLLEQNRKKARKYVHEYRLSGLLHCSECGAQIVGKSGTGKNGKYFYYGHKRKVVTQGDRHLHRCKVENISAPRLEEAIIARLKDLSDDRDLLKELARASSSESQSKREHQKSLLAAKEQERRKLEQKLNNLYESIAEEDDKVTRKGLSGKATEVQMQLEENVAVLAGLKSEYENHRNVVNVESAFEYLKIFKNGAFDSQPFRFNPSFFDCVCVGSSSRRMV